ncbi:hypothetical protein BC831DRAFT_459444 [Entophlyctis helioformis]|nr:hypothetical protein BC831DRAFT_459444 [Entophlyctis helioformis]
MQPMAATAAAGHLKAEPHGSWVRGHASSQSAAVATAAAAGTAQTAMRSGLPDFTGPLSNPHCPAPAPTDLVSKYAHHIGWSPKGKSQHPSGSLAAGGTLAASAWKAVPKRNARPKVPLTNEYSFLGPVKGFRANHFKLRTDFSRSLYERTFCDSEDSRAIGCKDLDAIMQQEYRDGYASCSDLLDKGRIRALNTTFQRIIQNFTTYSALLSEIQNEYMLVIRAIMNILDEKSFLRAKINKLLVEHATKDALEAEHQHIVQLVASWELATEQRQHTMVQDKEAEKRFLVRVSELFDKELAKKQPEKRRKDLTYLGRWRFVKDWIEERAPFDATLRDLHARLKEQPARYRSYFPEDEDVGIHDYDSTEVRKLKHHIEEQRKISRNYIKELAAVTEKRNNLQHQIVDVDERIEQVSDLIQSHIAQLPAASTDDLRTSSDEASSVPAAPATAAAAGAAAGSGADGSNGSGASSQEGVRDDQRGNNWPGQ